MRPAGEVVKLASSFPCDIVLKTCGMEASAKNLIGMIALEAHCGDQVLVQAKGERAAEAVGALSQLMASLPEFDEEQAARQRRAAGAEAPEVGPRAGPGKAAGRRSPRTSGGAAGGKRSGRRGRTRRQS